MYTQFQGSIGYENGTLQRKDYWLLSDSYTSGKLADLAD